MWHGGATTVGIALTSVEERENDGTAARACSQGSRAEHWKNMYAHGVCVRVCVRSRDQATNATI